MTFGAPETEALHEGTAQKSFGDPSLDGSPMPLGSTVTHETTEIPRSLWGVEVPRCHRAGNPVGQEAKQPKQINISDNQRSLGTSRRGLEIYR